VLVILEATGGFERAMVGALAAEGLPVVVVNPPQVRDFARATGKARQDRSDRRVDPSALRLLVRTAGSQASS
jgi:transposase